MRSVPKKRSISQLQYIAIGFLIMIAIGTALLMLPISSANGNSMGFLTSLFTATSASCVTGLVVVDTSIAWSFFGKLVILILIQIGGLGFISVGVFCAIIMRKKIGLRARGLIMESTNSLQIGGVVKLTRKILYGTLIFEGVGAVLLAFRFSKDFGVLRGIWYGIFHSVSAFCNAGFDLMGSRYGAYNSLSYYYQDLTVNFVIMSLIIIGGIGFIVWDDIHIHRFKFSRYKLHTKIVLLMTAILVFLGAVLLYFTELNAEISDMSMKGKILSSLFSSVTARTAGFNTIDTAKLTNSGKLLTMLLMFIGGSPGSTAGGIKATTVFVLLMYVRSNIGRTYGINVFNRRLDDEAVKVAAAIATINLSLVLIASFIIMAIQNLAMPDVLFEAFSAIGTVGMTTGITRDLTTASRVIIILLMYLGRVGSLSFALAFTQNKKIAHVMHAKEAISVG